MPLFRPNGREPTSSAALAGALLFALLYGNGAYGQFRRGDINGDGCVDVDDARELAEFLFVGLEGIDCLDAADANDDGEVALSDVNYIAAFAEKRGPPPRPPFPSCGGDPTEDPIGCESYPGPSCEASCGVTFRRGDANGDSELNLTDAIFILVFLFVGGEEPSCFDAGDATDDGALDLTDPIFVLSRLFLGGPPLPPPFPSCGIDETDDDPLTDCVYDACP